MVIKALKITSFI